MSNSAQSLAIATQGYVVKASSYRGTAISPLSGTVTQLKVTGEVQNG